MRPFIGSPMAPPSALHSRNSDARTPRRSRGTGSTNSGYAFTVGNVQLADASARSGTAAFMLVTRSSATSVTAMMPNPTQHRVPPAECGRRSIRRAAHRSRRPRPTR